MISESFNGVFDRVGLERPWFLHRALGVALFKLNVQILSEIDLCDLGMGVQDCALRDRSPRAGRHDPAQAEDRLLGAAEKLVDVTLAEPPALVVTLALDCHPLARRPPRHEVDSDVPAVELGQFHALRPVSPPPDLGRSRIPVPASRAA